MRIKAIRVGIPLVVLWSLCCLLSGPQAAGDEDPLDRIEQLLKTDSTEGALEQAESLAAFSPLEAEAQALYGIALLRAGHYTESEQALLAALGLDELCADAHLGMARIATGRNRLERAVYHFRQAASSRRFHGEALVEFGKLLAESGDCAAALKVAQAGPQELAYLNPVYLSNIKAALDFYKLVGEQGCLIVPASFQKTTVDLLPARESAEGFELAVALAIGGEEAGSFRVETGIGRQVILRRSLADRLALGKAGRFTVVISGSAGVPAEGVLLPDLELGGLKVERVPALAVEDAILPDGVQGLLGTGFLKLFNLTLDARSGMLQISRGDRPDLLLRGIDRRRAAVRLPVFIGPLPAIGVSVNGSAPAPFVIDTGAETTFVDAAWFDAHLADALPQGSVAVATAQGPTGLQQGRLFAAETLKLGDLEFKSVPLVVLDLSDLETAARQRIAGVIGRDLLLRFRLHFIFSQPELILEYH
jgi:predicted aspartyl protease